MPSLLQPRLRGRPHFLGHRGNRRPHFVQRDLLLLRRLVSALAYQKPVKLLAAGQYGRVSQSEVIRDVHRGPLWAVVPDFSLPGRPGFAGPLPEQLAIARAKGPHQVAAYDLHKAARGEIFRDQTTAATAARHERVTRGDTASDHIGHVVDGPN